MEGISALTGALAATAFGGTGLAAFLMTRTRSAPGAKPLAAFLVLVALWALGLAWQGPAGRALMALAPMGAASFVHFAANLSGRRGGAVIWPYALGGAAALAALANGSGVFLPWAGVGLFRYEGAGLLAVGVTIVLAGFGHGILVESWLRETGKRKRQIGVVIAASALGLASVTGLFFPVLGFEIYPWPLLLLPVYLAVLTYGILRYELMVANLWARRALTWGILAAGGLVLTAVPAGWLAADQPWVVSALAVAAALALWDPARRLVDRVVFPGGDVSAAELVAWRASLADVADEEEIARIARFLLLEKLRIDKVEVTDAPPGPRRVIETMAALQDEAVRDLARRRAFAERQRLAELGALAAIIAHDIRNPMNIIAMAMAEAEPTQRQEVKAQLARMDALVRDVLDYGKPWVVAPETIDVAAAVAEAAKGMTVTLDIPKGLTVNADRHRFGQALGNLLANANTIAGQVMVEAERAEGAVLIHVCDNGPGIPEDIRPSLFQPFVSRGSGGTGLGLSIVAKVMAAHGGSVSCGQRAGWNTCFTLRFPA